MNYSHVEKNLKFIIEYYRVNTGKELTEQDKIFFADVLNLTYGDGYQQAANLAAEIVYHERFKLSPDHFAWFHGMHRAHMKAMGYENQKKYSLPNVKDVVYDKVEDCLKVYYDDVWWHYDRRGTWY